MSTATVFPAAATTIATAEEAHVVLHMALGATAVWPECGEPRERVFSAVVVLGCALKNGGDAKAALAADSLIRVMSEHCGPGWGDLR